MTLNTPCELLGGGLSGEKTTGVVRKFGALPPGEGVQISLLKLVAE